jgi:DNA-binding transcriptional ArsR family regulator
LTNYILTDEDKKRAEGCEFYAQAKRVIRSMEDYRNVNVGEVYSIFYLRDDKSKRYISSHGSSTKDKYLVISKDDGFIFAKRLNSNGGTGKDVICLTIRFPSPSYTMELDGEQAEAIIFSQEESFDPFRQGRELKRKKDKARSENKKIVAKFKSAALAYKTITTLKVGDNIWDTKTAFGQGTVKWEVSKIESRPVDKTPVKDWNGHVYAHGNTQSDQEHNKENISMVVIVTIKVVGQLPKSRSWISKERTFTFKDFMSDYRYYFLKQPMSVDDET